MNDKHPHLETQSEIVNRMTARLRRNADLAAGLARIQEDVIPQMARDVRRLENATVGQQEALAIVKEALQQVEALTEIVSESGLALGVGIGHIQESTEDMTDLAAESADAAQIFEMFPVWVKANPDLLIDVLGLATEYSRRQALEKLTADELIVWRNDVTRAIENKGNNQAK